MPEFPNQITGYHYNRCLRLVKSSLQQILQQDKAIAKHQEIALARRIKISYYPGPALWKPCCFQNILEKNKSTVCVVFYEKPFNPAV
ncbi:MAG: hypothetical protein ACRC10_10310 [Thermoguttaceae bacterium]